MYMAIKTLFTRRNLGTVKASISDQAVLAITVSLQHPSRTIKFGPYFHKLRCLKRLPIYQNAPVNVICLSASTEARCKMLRLHLPPVSRGLGIHGTLTPCYVNWTAPRSKLVASTSFMSLCPHESRFRDAPCSLYLRCPGADALLPTHPSLANFSRLNISPTTFSCDLMPNRYQNHT